MKDNSITRSQLIDQLTQLQQRVAKLEAAEAQWTQTQETLKESERKYRTLVENSLQGIAILQHSRIVFANPAVAETLGYTIDELTSLSPDQGNALIHPQDRPQIWENVRDRLSGEPATSRYEFRAIRKDGTVCWLEIVPNRIEYGGQPAIQVLSMDVTERKQAEEQIKLSLQEKEVLLKEIHHRVKNNLSVISSLLNLQAETLGDERLRAAFQESQNRIQSMARVHEQLYQSKDLARVNMAAYIHSLGDYLCRSFGAQAVTLQVEAADVALTIETAIPCGLIINELVSNALKHAFPSQADISQNGDAPHKVCVALQAHDGLFELTISDTGVGLPVDLDLDSGGSLGLRLVNLLTQQLNGRLKIDRTAGTTFTLTFAAPCDTIKPKAR